MFGMQIIESSYCTKKQDYVVALGWRDRILSWPWRPWVKTRTITRNVPTAFEIWGKIYAHPSIVASLPKDRR